MRPGYVPSEDVAKYKVGQGSMKSQLAQAQAKHQAPATPSSCSSISGNVASTSQGASGGGVQVSIRSPADFKPKEARVYPTATSGTVKGGAETSRWATAPASPTPSSASVSGHNKRHDKPSQPSYRSPRIPTEAAPSAAATPVLTSTDRLTARPSTPHVSSPQLASTTTSNTSPVDAPGVKPEQAKSEPRVEPEPVRQPQGPPEETVSPSKDLELPPDIQGDWWDDEVDSAADALQGLGIAGGGNELDPPAPPRDVGKQGHDNGRPTMGSSAGKDGSDGMTIKGRGTFKGGSTTAAVVPGSSQAVLPSASNNSGNGKNGQDRKSSGQKSLSKKKSFDAGHPRAPSIANSSGQAPPLPPPVRVEEPSLLSRISVQPENMTIANIRERVAVLSKSAMEVRCGTASLVYSQLVHFRSVRII